ncbi:MAG TPA: methylmalonyl-CoA mutase family protein, partial [Bryobacteraceae bacterium]|nr:methylmalonyl-CoA mutase family protein [Bryobacteraceae bacterium]
TEFSARIARNTQLYLQQETAITRAVDPWGGSYYVERLTQDLMERAWGHLQEVERLGGMAKAIETGLPKMRIEEAAARRQARIDSGREVVVGVNRFQTELESSLPVLEVDNNAVRQKQLERLADVRARRDNDAVRSALAAIQRCASTGEGNLLELCVGAARARATLGEISMAMEEVFGRYRATSRAIAGVYRAESESDPDFQKARSLSDEFARAEGRRPRILIAKMGQDGHDRGSRVVATAFADEGFDVDIGPLFQTPAEVARMAVENDVHIVGVSTLAGGHKTLIPELIRELRSRGAEDILVVAGGVIPPADVAFLKDRGVSEIFGPGSVVPVCAQRILRLLLGRFEPKQVAESSGGRQ